MTLKILFDASTPVDISKAECSCVAGTVLYNHSVALLSVCELLHAETDSCTPILRCTEDEQHWCKPRTIGVKPGCVSSMVFLSAKMMEFTVADAVSTNYKAISGELPDLDVLKVDEAYQD